MDAQLKKQVLQQSDGRLPASSDQDTFDQLRAIRLKRLDDQPNHSERERARLEAEPLLRSNTTWSDYDLSILTMRLGYPHRRGSPGAYLSQNGQRSDGQLGFPERFAIRCALNEALPVNDLRTAMLQRVRKDHDFASLLRHSFYLSSSPEHQERLKEGLQFCRTYATTAIWRPCQHLGLQPLNLAEAFIDRFILHAARSFNSPVFYRSNTGAPTRIEAQPGFNDLLHTLSNEAHITAWIESQRNVHRSSDHSIVANRRIINLELTAYDTSRVKEFSLSNAHGQTLQVVSKRLGPMKSATAELEFECSKDLYARGVPTPQPVAVVHDHGNTYCLWKKIESEDEIPFNFPDQIAEQKQAIMQQLHCAGYEHLDVAERNFLYSMENEKPKVWIIDFERMRRRQ